MLGQEDDALTDMERRAGVVVAKKAVELGYTPEEASRLAAVALIAIHASRIPVPLKTLQGAIIGGSTLAYLYGHNAAGSVLGGLGWVIQILRD